jgi:hypothetical protein
MSYGPNRWGVHPKSTAIKAGGIKMFFRHPKLAGHVFNGANIDEVDVSRACKLNETFLDAQPSMDSAYQEVLVDGSVITITNNLLAGTLSLQVLEQGGFVGRGCFITALQLVQSSGDSVGGTFTTVRNFDGITRIRVYYGVFVRNVPHERIAGNAVVPYPVQLYYAGWFDGVGSEGVVAKDYIWAVGNSRGTTGNYRPFAENEMDTTTPGVGGVVAPVQLHSNNADGLVDDLNSFADIPRDGLVDSNDGTGSLPAPYNNINYVKPIDPSMKDFYPAPESP